MSTRNDIPSPIESTADALRVGHLLETHLRNMGLGAQADLAMRLRVWLTKQDHDEEMGSPGKDYYSDRPHWVGD